MIILSFSCVQDELMAELEELEQEELNKKMTNVRLPNVPSTSLPAQPDRTPGRRPGVGASAQRSRPGVSPLTWWPRRQPARSLLALSFYSINIYLLIRNLYLLSMLKVSPSPVTNFYPSSVLASSRRAEEEDDDIKQLAAWAT